MGTAPESLGTGRAGGPADRRGVMEVKPITTAFRDLPCFSCKHFDAESPDYVWPRFPRASHSRSCFWRTTTPSPIPAITAFSSNVQRPSRSCPSAGRPEMTTLIPLPLASGVEHLAADPGDDADGQRVHPT